MDTAWYRCVIPDMFEMHIYHVFVKINLNWFNILIVQATHEIQTLPDVSALRAAVWSSLPLDRELRWGKKPPLVCALSGCPACRLIVGIVHGLVSKVLCYASISCLVYPKIKNVIICRSWLYFEKCFSDFVSIMEVNVFLNGLSYDVQVRLQSCPHLAAMVKDQWCASGSSSGGGRSVSDRASPLGVSPVPGISKYHHVGVHVSSQNLLPQALRHRREPFWPRDPAQPLGLLLRVGTRGLGACVFQARQWSHLIHISTWTS